MDQSFNDLKFQIQQEFQKDGMVENMKTQLRYKLLERLQLQQKKIPTSDKVNDSDMLLRRVLASLVADYLKANQMEYCLSVFVPESTFGNAILNKDELKLLMKIEQIQGSVLQTLVGDILLLRPREPLRTNSATQTYTGDAIMNLEQKLSQVDNMYKARMEGELLQPQLDMEQKLLKLKKDYDMRLKAELNAEITRVKEFEVSNMRLEEADKYRSKMQNYREELEKNYQDKLNKLRDRERDTLEKSGAKMKELESMNYNYRQKILKEHEHIKLKEQELEKQKIANEESHKFQKARLDILERELQKKTADVSANELTMRRTIEAQVRATKQDSESGFYEEREQLRQKQKMMEQDLLKMEQFKMQIATLQKENQQVISENEKYIEQIRELKKTKKTVEIEFDNLREQIRALADAQRREQELNRRYETDIRLKEEEIALLKTTVNHKDGMIGDHKSLHQEGTRKLQKDIEMYQQKIETQELLIKDLQLMKENHNPNFQIESALFKANVMDSMIQTHNIVDHRNKLDHLQKELNDNRLKRRDEIKRLQDDAIVPLNIDQHLKFENVWDNYNTSVNFSQAPSQFRPTERDNMKIFNQGDEAQSQVFNSGVFNKKQQQTQQQGQQYQQSPNIIDETYQELL